MTASIVVCGRTGHASCFDGVRNGPESDVDCGGDCPPCDVERACRIARDCESGRCAEGQCDERPYHEGEAVPPGYTVAFSEHDSAAITRQIGFASLGVGYGAAYFAALSLPGELSWLYAPVIGPWVEVADESQSYRGLIAVDGAVQLVGFVLLVGGIITAGQKVIREDEPVPLVERASVAPTTIGKDGYGVGVSGAF